MTSFVKVVLTVAALVDGDYSPDDHAEDIVENARQLFSMAEVNIERIEVSRSADPESALESRDMRG